MPIRDEDSERGKVLTVNRVTRLNETESLLIPARPDFRCELVEMSFLVYVRENTIRSIRPFPTCRAIINIAKVPPGTAFKPKSSRVAFCHVFFFIRSFARRCNTSSCLTLSFPGTYEETWQA